MTKNDISTRRRFLKAGAALSVPLAAVPAFAGDGSAARLARLEDERAIRHLHQAWLQRINAGTAGGRELTLLNVPAEEGEVRSIAAQQAGPPDEIEIAAGGKRATGRFHCTVEMATPIAKDCTLAQMAHLQGGGFVCRTEPRILVVGYEKRGGSWSVARAALTAA